MCDRDSRNTHKERRHSDTGQIDDLLRAVGCVAEDELAESELPKCCVVWDSTAAMAAFARIPLWMARRAR